MRDIVFLLFYATPLALAFRSIPVSIMNWAWVSLAAPNDFLFGVAELLPLNKIVAVASVIAIITGKERKRLRCDATGALALAFLVVMALGQIGASAAVASGWTLLDKFWKIVALLLLVSSFINTAPRIHALVVTLALGVGFVGAADGCKFILSGGSFHAVGNNAWGDNNQEALFLLMGLPLLTYLRGALTHPLARLGALTGLILLLLAIIATNSRGALIGLVILAVSGFSVSRRKGMYLAGMVLAVIVLASVVPASWTERMNTIDHADSDDSFMGRVVAWKVSTAIALDNPLGGGLHAVQMPAIWGHYKLLIGPFSFISTPPPDTIPHAAHSIYFEVLGDTGFGGLFLFLAILVTNMARLRRTARRVRGRPDLQWADALARQLQLSVLVYMVSGAALSAAYHDMPWLIIGLSGALGRLVAEQVGAAQPVRRTRRPAPLAAPATPTALPPQHSF